MKRVALATVILSAVALTAFAQQSVRLSGRVVTDESGDPLPNARVTIVAAGSSGNVTLTDRDGRFTLAAPPGRVTLSASKSSYSRAETSTAERQANRVPAGARRRDLGPRRRRARRSGDGRSVFVEKASGGLEATTFTDDRGEYRLGGVASGTFTLAVAATGAPVRLTDGQNQVLFTNERRTIYYPGVTTRTEAEPIRLQPGDDTTATDFVAAGAQSIGQAMMTALLIPNGPRAPDASVPKTGVIRGRIVTSDGRPVAHALVRAVSRPAAPGRPPAAFATVTVTADDDGRFEFPDLPAGSFQITASKVGYSMPRLAVAIRAATARCGTDGRSRRRRNARARRHQDGALERDERAHLRRARRSAARRERAAAAGPVSGGPAAPGRGGRRVKSVRRPRALPRVHRPARPLHRQRDRRRRVHRRAARLCARLLPGDAERRRGGVRHGGALAGAVRHRVLAVAREDRHDFWNIAECRRRTVDDGQRQADAEPAFGIGDQHPGRSAADEGRQVRVPECHAGSVRDSGRSRQAELVNRGRIRDAAGRRRRRRRYGSRRCRRRAARRSAGRVSFDAYLVRRCRHPVRSRSRRSRSIRICRRRRRRTPTCTPTGVSRSTASTARGVCS